MKEQLPIPERRIPEVRRGIRMDYPQMAAQGVPGIDVEP